jgi:hypothetical protein
MWRVTALMTGAPTGVPPMKTSMYSPITRPRSRGSTASWTDAFAMAWNTRLTRPMAAITGRKAGSPGMTDAVT